MAKTPGGQENPGDSDAAAGPAAAGTDPVPADTGAPADGTPPAEGSSPAGDSVGTPAPPDEGTAQPGGTPADPASPAAASEPPAAAPLAPPGRRNRRGAPDPQVTEPSAAMRPAPEQGHVAIVDDADKPIHHADLFHDPGGNFTFMTAARRIYQVFRYPGQHEGSPRTSKILLFHQGARVPRDKAHELITATRNGTAPSPDSGDSTGGDIISGSGTAPGDGQDDGTQS